MVKDIGERSLGSQELKCFYEENNEYNRHHENMVY